MRTRDMEDDQLPEVPETQLKLLDAIEGWESDKEEEHDEIVVKEAENDHEGQKESTQMQVAASEKDAEEGEKKEEEEDTPPREATTVDDVAKENTDRYEDIPIAQQIALDNLEGK